MGAPEPTIIDELPAYSHIDAAEPTLASHKYHLSHGDSAPWLTLTLVSHAARASQGYNSLPVYVVGQPMRGSIALALPKEDAIEAIRVIVDGYVTRTETYELERIPFARVAQTVWDRGMGDPRGSSAMASEPYKGKLSGNFEWPFAITLPNTAEISLKDKDVGEGVREYPLPPAFHGKGSFKWAVAYEVKVKVERAFFRPNDSLAVPVGYVPAVKPDPASYLRQTAYEDATPELIGPDGDPEGWQTCDPVVTQGSLFGEREVKVVAKLSLAKPLSYTRGSVVPLFLWLESADEQALDLLSTPSAPAVDLVVHFDFQSKTIAASDKYEDDSYHHHKMTLATARWWTPPGDHTVINGKRVLQGELHLAPELVPSFVFSSLSVSYWITVYNFEATGYKSQNDGVKESGLTELLAQRVEVATVWPDGPRPHCFTPPAYGPPKRQIGLGGFYWWGGDKPYEA
ncbi:hypothetical protein PUNSTDRAFT_137569 [Punctularia strigosozonata HHB-11173 SS5]|uniref:uncharacterized protein n=1 Tax=Punctularia strigosozonata (strain HHB-11173) TaxID=741275 RepID=UPI00044172D7|nr:uncharacterized protein PUNSTDRAFT_137569 [Punctularia strigosozonata HHB-11173 SS5]EIN05456.1 hypothetical protein PUNSTDRAFT_137569 [Punctularia strigosozonata HHB-11173 SS5]